MYTYNDFYTSDYTSIFFFLWGIKLHNCPEIVMKTKLWFLKNFGILPFIISKEEYCNKTPLELINTLF